MVVKGIGFSAGIEWPWRWRNMEEPDRYELRCDWRRLSEKKLEEMRTDRLDYVYIWIRHGINCFIAPPWVNLNTKSRYPRR